LVVTVGTDLHGVAPEDHGFGQVVNLITNSTNERMDFGLLVGEQ
jgi:hypothetical protein